MADYSSVNLKKPTISVMGKDGSIEIHKNTVRVLDYPEYICLRISKKKNSLLLRPCEATDVLSFQMPRDFMKRTQVHYRIHSLLFVRDLLRTNNLNQEGSYYLDGKYVKEGNAVVFSLNTARPVFHDTKIDGGPKE